MALESKISKERSQHLRKRMRIFAHKPYISRNQNHWRTFCRWQMGLSSFKYFWWASLNDFSTRVRFGHSRSSKVVDFGTNRKRTWDYLLVRRSNLGPVFHRFRDIAAFVLMTPPLFHPNFESVPVGPDRWCWGSLWARTLSYSAVKLFLKYSHLCDKWTDGLTDRLWITALCVRAAKTAALYKLHQNVWQPVTGGERVLPRPLGESTRGKGIKED